MIYIKYIILIRKNKTIYQKKNFISIKNKKNIYIFYFLYISKFVLYYYCKILFMYFLLLKLKKKKIHK